MEGLQQLLYLHGIGYDYIKYTGEHVVFDHETRNRALHACGVDTSDDKYIEEKIYQLDIAQWQSVISSVSLVDEQNATLAIKLPEQHRAITGVLSIPSLDINHHFDTAHCMVSGEYNYGGINYLELQVPLPSMPVGYHDAEITLPLGQFKTQVWSTPKQCYKAQAHKQVGVSTQLYTLKSVRNLGVGDFLDLEELIVYSAKAGCDFVLLNPLHLLFCDEPDRASPYSPNHRGLINPLYIAIESSAWLHGNTEFETALEQALSVLTEQKQLQYIDYSVVSESKYALLALSFCIFKAEAAEIDKQAFKNYQLQNKVLLEALSGDDFAVFCQWLATQQLERCQRVAKDNKMAIGLINDLAVGCAKDGIEYTQNSDLYATGAQVGAPPDPWAQNGQDWGLPALDPIQIKQNKFQFFKSLVKNNLCNVGGLRIDHVMALRRLWWCLQLESGVSGCYVYYPFEYLLAVLKIESNLSQSIVIGEDLGVVPPEVVSAMKESSLLGNILFYFEKDAHGNFVKNEHLRKDTILMIANHDVPPFKGWWNADDLQLKLQYNLLSVNEFDEQSANRYTQKQQLIYWLHQHQHQTSGLDINCDSQVVYQAMLCVLALSPVHLLCIQLDDLDQQVLPVNIPGTDTEYPNWRRRLNHTVPEVFSKHTDFIKNLTQLRTSHE
ncbi:4-alpha-glucanotransferase [Pseudoalteromonas citrea]|uniref:4-alpha-glucanotransferase n=2 Tax=Pseudoalteromonas citrea TaxID=43655 RepID=A0AAD4AEQ5_9GAMM|nr:4-alpha-glucanotransferase [Pseudoalteromonas citrea]KAF7764576.1 4-alpha-glucanotransferase [Pseudoalteromonas citrea]